MKRFLYITTFGFFAVLLAPQAMAQNTYYNSSSQKAGSNYNYNSDQQGRSNYIARRDGGSVGSGYSTSTAPLNLKSYSNPSYTGERNQRQEQSGGIVPFGAKPKAISSPYAMSTEDIIRERARINRELEEHAQKTQDDYEARIRQSAKTVAYDEVAREYELAKDDPTLAYSLGLGEKTDLSDRIEGLLGEIEDLETIAAADDDVDTSDYTNKEKVAFEEKKEKRRKVIYNKKVDAEDSYLKRSITSSR